MSILVCGAAGFIGTNLVEYLANQGQQVIALDSFISSGGYADFPIVNGDICDSGCLRAVSISDVSYVINLACPASPPIYQKYPLETIAACTQGVKNICDYCVDTGATLIHTSTSEVYGDPEISPQSEWYRGSVNTLGPRSCYDEGKRISETIIYEYAHKYGLNAIIFRLFNTYGPKMSLHDGRVISNLIKAYVTRSPFEVYGDGTQTRSFCYVSDMIEAFNIVINKKPKGFNFFNVGNPAEITINELWEKFASLTGSDCPVKVYGDPAIDDPRQRRPDIRKIQKYANWTPRVSIDAGLTRMIEFYGA